MLLLIKTNLKSLLYANYMDIYEPSEDSYLLAGCVKNYAFGSVLDMGTGSGILAKTASESKKVSIVIAADINPAAKKHLGKMKFVQSDLFSKITGKFDTIIFNPPYLPQDKGIEDSALYGGKKGYETIERFLNGCNAHLKKDGIILLLFSNLTNKERIEEIIANNCLEFEEIARKKLEMMETLYVYKIEKTGLLKELEEKKITHVMKFAKGNRGIIYTGLLGRKKIAIKAKNPKSDAPERIANEAKWLIRLNEKGIGPKHLFHAGNKYLAYEFAEGNLLKDAKITKKILAEILRQCRTLDTMNVSKEEMTRPYSHAVIGKKIVMLDFERCTYSENPQNVTQFCQFIAKSHKNKEEIRNAAQKYSRDKSDKNFEKIVRLI